MVRISYCKDDSQGEYSNRCRSIRKACKKRLKGKQVRILHDLVTVIREYPLLNVTGQKSGKAGGRDEL